jgi:hypothetical protein
MEPASLYSRGNNRTSLQKVYGLLLTVLHHSKGVQLEDSPPAAVVGDPSVAAVAGAPSTATIAADPSAAAVAADPSAAAVAGAHSAAAGIGRRICLDLLGFVFTLSLGIRLRWALLPVMVLSLRDMSLEDLVILSLLEES